MPGRFIGVSPLRFRGSSSVPIDPEAQVFFSRLPDPIPLASKIAINNFVLGVKLDEGITNLTDRFIKIHLRPSSVGSAANALLNLVQAAYDSQIVILDGSLMKWGQNGFSAEIVGSHLYLRENWTPSTQGGTVFTLNDCGIGWYGHGNNQSEGYIYGTYKAVTFNGFLHQLKRVTTNITNIFSNNTGGVTAPATGDVDGFNLNLRTTNLLTNRTRNGSSIEIISAVSVELSPNELYSMCGNGAGTAVAFDGRTQSALVVCNGTIDMAKFSTRMETLMVALNCSAYTLHTTAVAFGDSITEGAYADNGYGWFPRVCTSRNFNCSNLGQSGTTLQRAIPVDYFNPTNMYDRQTEIPAYTNQSYLFFAYGRNDWAAFEDGGTNYTAANMQTQYGEIIDYAIGTKGWSASNIVIVEPYWQVLANANYNTYRAAALATSVAKGTKYVPVFDAMLAGGGAALMNVDGIHPNTAGHELIKTLVIAQL